MDDTFRMRLKQLRLDSGKTQDDMAKTLNIKRSTYGEYERGKNMPPVDKIEQIAMTLGVPPNSLVGWETQGVTENNVRTENAEYLKQVETWGMEFGETVFSEFELSELIDYARYILSKRNK